MYDAVIVGAGPAGSSAAWTLRRAGLSAVLLERGKPDREKPCGGGIPVDTLSRIPFDVSPVIEGWIERVVFRLQDRRQVSAALPPRTMAMVSRSSFDSLLAAASGAELQAGRRITELRSGPECAEAVCADGSVYRGRYCILAAGGLSPFDGVMGANNGRAPRGIALVSEPAAEPELLQREAGTARFEFGTIAGGYIWTFPKAGYLSVGAGRFHDSGRGMAELTREAAARMGIPGAGTLRFRGYPILLPQPSVVLRRGRFLRVGEAAGLVDPLVGEGIRHAVRSGELAAAAVIADDPELYERRCRREILADLLAARPLARLFYSFPGLAFRLGVENPLFLREFVRIFCGRGSYRRMAARLPFYAAAAPFIRSHPRN